jgi:hypothetical protein
MVVSKQQQGHQLVYQVSQQQAAHGNGCTPHPCRELHQQLLTGSVCLRSSALEAHLNASVSCTAYVALICFGCVHSSWCRVALLKPWRTCCPNCMAPARTHDTGGCCC